MYDGAVYQRKFGRGRFLSEPYNLSLKLNTHGVAIFQSSQFGVWPLFLLVNELPPSLRYVNKSKCLYDDETIIKLERKNMYLYIIRGSIFSHSLRSNNNPDIENDPSELFMHLSMSSSREGGVHYCVWYSL